MNVMELNSFSFTIIDCDILSIKNYLEKQNNRYSITYENMNIEKIYFENMYLQQLKGVARGIFYNPEPASNLTVVLGDGYGSWGSLCNKISSNLLINNIQIQINDENSDVLRNCIILYDGKMQKHIREVQGHMGDFNRMEFIQAGTPLWFENIDYYKKRKIMDRLNKNILIEYARKIGIDLTDNNLFKSNQKNLYVELGRRI